MVWSKAKMDALNTDGLFWILLLFTILKNLINTEEACKRLWSRFTYDAEEVGICFFERAQCLAYICREHWGNPFGVDQSTNADHFHVVHWWWESRAPSFSHNIRCLYTFLIHKFYILTLNLELLELPRKGIIF